MSRARKPKVMVGARIDSDLAQLVKLDCQYSAKSVSWLIESLLYLHVAVRLALAKRDRGLPLSSRERWLLDGMDAVPALKGNAGSNVVKKLSGKK